MSASAGQGYVGCGPTCYSVSAIWVTLRSYEGNFAVLGDLNDYIDSDSSLRLLLDCPG